MDYIFMHVNTKDWKHKHKFPAVQSLNFNSDLQICICKGHLNSRRCKYHRLLTFWLHGSVRGLKKFSETYGPDR